MAVSILVSDEIFKRLEIRAVGFDTPERVIERLLDEVDSGTTQEKKPTISFYPNECTFKSELLVHKRAEIVLHMRNGEREVIHWNANRFKPSSNLRANLWSGYLRGWKEKEIVSAELSVLERGTAEPGDDTELCVAIANNINWTFDEVQEYFIEIETIESDDGCPYYNLVTFSDQVPNNLKDMANLSDCYQVRLDLILIDEEPDLT